MAKKLVSIIVVTRNRRKVTLACLRSVFKMNYPNFKVILVDNGSTDGTIATVKKQFPKVKIADAKKNLGLNGGKNLGQKQAKGKYILFLDSDIVVDKNFLKELVEVAESDQTIGIVCPKMYYYDRKNVVWYAGSFVNLLTSRTENVNANQVDKGQFNKIKETQFAPTAYLVTRAVVKKIKNHNEDFFMTYGDTDYGFRAREAGFKVVFAPKAHLWHRLKKKENKKTIRALGYNLPMRAYYFSRNRVIFMKRHASKLNFVVFIFFFFPFFTLYITYKIIALGGGFKFLKPHWQGSLDGLKYIFNGRIINAYK